VSDCAKSAFFDGIADKWDGWEDLGALEHKFFSGFDGFGLGPDETVLDVGCGTGNLTLALLKRLSSQGRVVSMDISPKMIGVAQGKIKDARVTWHVADAQKIPMEDQSCDRVICYSVWPHFEDFDAVAGEISRVLRPSGKIHVWHLIGRDRVNQIHSTAGEAVRKDVLAPASQTGELLSRSGFQVETTIDNDNQYLVTGIKSR